ncbi:DNA-binding protein [Limosilactobacillus fermentum]|uniref:helix-turn-helix domain-containing protein n=1 Tax=Limosilactobacillus fermentum TaxID=1613 RepID=UPI0010760136|nr:helix-turn-helix domain-containing protein [Limosilactobacillus fermentum]TFZ18804.1 DNA-binding protein [Limosilactobacillus fermentum]
MEIKLQLPDEFAGMIAKCLADQLGQQKPHPQMKADAWLNKGEASKYLKVSRVFLDELIKSQSLPCKRIGTRSYRFKKADLDDWLRSQQ